MYKNACKLMLVCGLLIRYAYATGGFYAGVGLGYGAFNSTLQSNLIWNDSNNSTQNTGNLAYSLYAGYNFNPFAGVQLEYNRILDTQVANSYQVDQQLLGVDLLGYFPLVGFSSYLSKILLFAKVGIDYNVLDYSNVTAICNSCINLPNSSFTYLPVYGAGFQYNISPVSIRLEWNYMPNNTASNYGISQVTTYSNLYLASVNYNF